MKRRTVAVTLVTGRMYKIRHRSKAQPHDLVSVLRYLGVKNRPGPVAHRFSARPVAGVQTLPHRHIVSVEQVASTETPIVGYRWTEIQPARIRARRHHMKTAKRSGRRS